MIEYKGYVGIFEFEEENNVFCGKVSNIDDLVTFQGKSVKEVITLPHSGRLGGLEQPKGLPVASKVRIHRIHWNLAHRAVVGFECTL